MQRPPYLLDIPADEYHAATKRNEFTTSHRLNLFRKCPALYHKHITGEIVEGDTEAFMLGRALHTLVLEGADKFDSEYVVSDGPTNEKTGKPYGKVTKAYQEWAAAQTMPVISAEDHALMLNMSDAVHAHPVAKELLADGIAEGTIRTKWNGEPVQARLDWFNPDRNYIVDLKSCNDVDRFRFDIQDFGYIEQMAFYAKCVSIEREAIYGANPTDEPPHCYLIAVEKKEPFRVLVVNIVAATIDSAAHDHMANEYLRDDAAAMLDELKKCRETDVWPTRYEKVVYI